MTNAWVEKSKAKYADMKRRRRFAQIDTFSGPAKTYTRHWAMAIILGVPITAGVSIWILHKTPAELGNAASWASAIATTAAISIALWQAYAAKQTARLERRRQDRMIFDERRAAEKLHREAIAAQSAERMVDRLVELLEAWEIYTLDTNDLVARARVRALVAGLPGTFARQASIAVGASRAPYLHGMYQPAHTLYWPGYRNILEGHVERLEIEFNIRQLRNTDEAGGLQVVFHDFIRRNENLYNASLLTEEDEERLQREYAEKLASGEPDDIRAPDPAEDAPIPEGLPLDEVFKRMEKRTAQKNASLHQY